MVWRRGRSRWRPGPPRVLLDARWYTDGPPSGHLVTRKLIDALTAQDEDAFQYLLLVRGSRADITALRNLHPHWKVVRDPFHNLLLGSVCVVPLVAAAHRVHAVVSQNFCAPWGCPVRIVLIYDAIYERRPDLFTRLERSYLSLIRILAHRSTSILTISSREAAHLRRWNLGAAKPIDIVPLAPRAATRRSASRLVRPSLEGVSGYLLHLGRVNVRKNIDMVVRAASRARTVTTTHPLVIAGPVEASMVSWVERTQADNPGFLLVLGKVTDDMVEELLRGASALITLSEDEGFGLPPLEAMAYGVPVIASTGAIAERKLRDAAVVVDFPLDVDAVATAIDSVHTDEGLRAALIAMGKTVAGEYTWPRSALVLRQAISTALESALSLRNSTSCN